MTQPSQEQHVPSDESKQLTRSSAAYTATVNSSSHLWDSFELEFEAVFVLIMLRDSSCLYSMGFWCKLAENLVLYLAFVGCKSCRLQY